MRELPEFRRDEHGQELPTYGVWCRHEARWVALGKFSLREAWWAILEQASQTAHPRELEIRALDPDQVDYVVTTCRTCKGKGGIRLRVPVDTDSGTLSP